MKICKHEFVYDELNKQIVCEICGCVLSKKDKFKILQHGLDMLWLDEKNDELNKERE